MSNSKIEVGYVFKFDCNNEVLRLKMTKEHEEDDGEILSLPNASALARVSREIKPHPESMTTWYDLDFPAVVHNAFTMRVTETEIRDMGGELDFLASAPVIADEIIAASIRGDHEEAISIWTWVGKSDAPEQPALIEMHKNPAVGEALVASVSATRTQPSEEERMRGQNNILDAKRRLHSLGYRNCVDQLTGRPVWAHMHTALRIPFTGDAFSASFVVDDLGTSVEEYDEKGRPVTRSLIEQSLTFRPRQVAKLPAGVEAVVEAAKATTGPSAKDMMREENERKDAERRLWALGYDCYVDEATGFSYWAQGKDGLRYNQDYHHSDARKVLELLNKT